MSPKGWSPIKDYSKEFRRGIEQKREAQEVQSGLESGLMGICREKGGLTLLWMSGSLLKLDHVSRTAREDWTTEEALSGSGEED